MVSDLRRKKHSLRTLALQNPILYVLVAEGNNVLGRQTGLWSTGPKV
jgi:hypothetical protein